MISMETANHVAQSWIDAWDAHDLDAIMEHYADDVEFWSPLIVKRLGIASGKLTGKPALRDYFARGLAAIPDLHFTLLQVLPGVDSVTVYYRNQNGAEVAEVTVLAADHRAVMVRVHYSPSSSVWNT
jgi:ketosteroid isomerase-like protein